MIGIVYHEAMAVTTERHNKCWFNLNFARHHFRHKMDTEEIFQVIRG